MKSLKDASASIGDTGDVLIGGITVEHTAEYSNVAQVSQVVTSNTTINSPSQTEVIHDTNLTALAAPDPPLPGIKAEVMQEPLPTDSQLIPGTGKVRRPRRDVPECEKRICSIPGCTKLASRKGERHDVCIAHGGGRRCLIEGCRRTAARTGENPHHCLLHGGGKRCKHENCLRLAVSPTLFCKAHGGGRRCSHEGCTKSSRWPTTLCISHGGGQRCKRDGCNKLAKAKGGLCISHSRLMPTMLDEAAKAVSS